ncbi:DUF1972 domain-containing protein [Paenibacillus sp. FA6]|uniref:DUF1972 domain-containing protein n=1 Tax=Paenibacillus sp. FA6 TaxID=3413029 RepID=UPI003F6600E8
MKATVAFCGTRGIPAAYGGFETAVDEISLRLVQEGVDCHVFGRSEAEGNHDSIDDRTIINVKGSPSRKLDTFVSSINTGKYLFKHRKEYDFVFWFNNANLPGILLTRLARIPMAVNTDGLEWRRMKWSWPFKCYYFLSSLLICLFCKKLISDSVAIQNYYKSTFFRKTQFIPYGAPIISQMDEEKKSEIMKKYELNGQKYFIQITRFELDNLPLKIIEGFNQSKLYEEGYQFILVGYRDSTPYSELLKSFDQKKGVRILAANYNQEELAVLRENAECYLHGNSVGGTNPALLEAMGSCKRVMAIDGPFSEEVLGGYGLLFTQERLAEQFREVINMEDQSGGMKERLYSNYQWDAVARSYRELMTSKSTNYLNQVERNAEIEQEVLYDRRHSSYI